MIKAVTFDFWGTLYSEDESALSRRWERRVAIVQSFLAAAGRTLEGPFIRGAIERAARRFSELHRTEQRNYTHGEAGRIIGAELGFDLTEEQATMLAELISAAGVQAPPRPLEGVLELLERLHAKLKIGIISDTGLTYGMHLRGVMEADGLARFIDQFTWSDQTLTTKPMTRQFLYTLAMLGARPEEAVHVGDLEHRDVVGGQSVGMRTIRIVSDAEGRHSHADATVANLSTIPAVLKRWGAELE